MHFHCTRGIFHYIHITEQKVLLNVNTYTHVRKDRGQGSLLLFFYAKHNKCIQIREFGVTTTRKESQSFPSDLCNEGRQIPS